MDTPDLIQKLTIEFEPTPRHAALIRIGGVVGVGAALSFALLLAVFGLRTDLAAASLTAPFWMKWAFTLALTAAALVSVRRMGKPDGRLGAARWGLAVPVAATSAMALAELLVAPAADRTGLILGHTAARCSVSILLLAIPVYLFVILGLRRLAPTRLREAGACAGALSGAVAAGVYAFTCPESTVAFLATWYTAGVVVAAAAGALLGPRLLRW